MAINWDVDFFGVDTNVHEMFHGNYSEPIYDWEYLCYIHLYKLFDAKLNSLIGQEIPEDSIRINPKLVTDITLQIAPTLDIDYLGNPMYGKPKRLLKVSNSHIGELSITFADDLMLDESGEYDGDVLNTTLGYLYGGDLDRLEGNFPVLKPQSFAMDVFQIGRSQIINRTDNNNTPEPSVIFHHRFDGCNILDINLPSFSTEDAEIKKYQCTMSVSKAKIYLSNAGSIPIPPL